jgi:hypothetical protein
MGLTEIQKQTIRTIAPKVGVDKRTVAELKFRAVFFCHFNKIFVNHLLVS